LDEESSDSSSDDDESYASESSIPTISKETREELVAKIRLRFAVCEFFEEFFLNSLFY